jgi:hydroxyethylthiazole kinase-like uncharacterized protein yjeF
MKTVLLPWCDEYKCDLMRICNSVDRTYLSGRLPEPYTEADADWWLGMVREHDCVDGLFRAISVDGKIVGNISVECGSGVFCRDGEIGYLLETEYWSKGIMTEAVSLMCDEAWAKLDIARITGLVYAGNIASKRVLEKNGFVCEGYRRDAVCKKDKVYDAYLFGKLRDADRVVSVDLMRRSDAYTIRHLVPSKELMYRAANGVYRAYDGWAGKRIAIMVGGGNNGGDGYALAGILKNEGVDSVIYKVSDKMSDDGAYYCRIAEELGVEIRDFGRNVNERNHEEVGTENCDFGSGTNLSTFDVIVDCILGTGFKGEVRGRARDAIEAVNSSGAFVISVDINSGMNGDTGFAPMAVRSDLTVSIGSYKQGLFRGDADKYIGRRTNVDIGIVLLDE